MKHYSNQEFTTGNYTEYFKKIILNFPALQEFRELSGNFLDIGCGSGTQIFLIAPHFREFSFTGIDISDSNIRACNKALSNMPDCSRFIFIHDDFSKHALESKFLVVFSYSVFQVLNTSMEDLLRTVRELLEPNGYFILSMPYHCKYNICLNYLRGLIGKLRSDLFDRFVVDIAHVLYRKKFSKNFLRERMIYLDQVDNNLLDIKQIEALHQFWKIEFQEKTPSPSFIQSKHMTLFLRKLEPADSLSRDPVK